MPMGKQETMVSPGLERTLMAFPGSDAAASTTGAALPVDGGRTVP